ncbi:tRNA-dihydrouridine synthase family protein [Desulfolutivibrio sulfoxidireducens]|nr:tRNA-dihydrouridine synthase family protein [Desulfolutivibrio sulfoxidireducens]
METPALPLPFSPRAPWLAPMAGFSDLAFRMLCRENGCAAAVTEMVSAKGLFFGSPGTSRLLATCPGDAPLVAQLFGSEPDYLARAVFWLSQRGFRHFDLNAGCPVPKVARSGAGAALLDDPGRLENIVRAMVGAAGEAFPGASPMVGVKLRLGVRPPQPVCLEIGPRLVEAGASWLTLHPRFATQGYAGRSDWTAIARLVRLVPVPVMASGDLWTAEDGAACLAATGAAGVMFARGALADPRIFSDLKTRLAGEAARVPNGPDMAALIRRHAALVRALDPSPRGLLKMRTAVPRYLKGLEGSRALRARVCGCSTWEDIEATAEETARLSPAART